MEIQGASVVISHNIKQGKEKDYEEWLNEIVPICRDSPGNIDLQIIHPIPNVTFAYTVIIRFDTISNLKDWIESTTRKKLIEKALPFFTKDDNYVIKTGLDFLFVPEISKVLAPVPWKQFLVTWSAIFPLSILIPSVVLPLLRNFNFDSNRYLNSLFVSGVVVFLMVYVVMPNYIKLIKKWLYK